MCAEAGPIHVAVRCSSLPHPRTSDLAGARGTLPAGAACAEVMAIGLGKDYGCTWRRVRCRVQGWPVFADATKRGAAAAEASAHAAHALPTRAAVASAFWSPGLHPGTALHPLPALRLLFQRRLPHVPHVMRRPTRASYLLGHVGAVCNRHTLVFESTQVTSAYVAKLKAKLKVHWPTLNQLHARAGRTGMGQG
jgi:hypothetical protein